MAKMSPWLIIALVVIIIVALSGESILIGIGNAFDDAWDFWGKLWTFGQDKGQFGSIGLGITILYADGTSEDYNPSGSWLLPLTILIDDKAISSITWSVLLKVDWEGTLNSLEATGDMEVWTMTGSTLLGSASISYSGIPSRNTWQIIESMTLTDTQLEDKLPDGLFWVLEAYATSTMVFTFADGTTVTKTPEMGPSQIHITHQIDGLTVFQIDLTSSVV